jgi:SAM-dependent methyltransferase
LTPLTTSDYYERYWRRSRSFGQGGPYDTLERLFDRYVEPQTRWVDVGCGDGDTAGPSLVARRADYQGVDISEAAIERGRAAGLDVRVVPDIGRLPFEDQVFDGALLLEVLEHLFEPQLALGETARVVRPGGVLIATVPNVAYWRRRADSLAGRWNPAGDELSRDEPWRDPHIRFFTQASFCRLLSDSGFDVVEAGAHWGVLLADLPGLSKIGSMRRDGLRLDQLRRSSPAYRALERRLPSLLGLRLHAVARRRSGT